MEGFEAMCMVVDAVHHIYPSARLSAKQLCYEIGHQDFFGPDLHNIMPHA